MTMKLDFMLDLKICEYMGRMFYNAIFSLFLL